jgi:hypothetical protein
MRKIKLGKLMSLLILTLVIVITGCDRRLLYVGNSTSSSINGSFKLFTGTENKNINLKQGEILNIKYTSEVTSGKLFIQLFNPEKELVKDFKTNASDDVEVKAEESGKYQIKVIGEDASGSFDVNFSVK